MLAEPPTMQPTLWDGRPEVEVIRERCIVLQNIGRDPKSRAIALELSRRDLIFWIENFVWTFDPRRMPGSPIIPFILFPHQKEYLLWRIERRKNRENGVCEKSRDSGMSWLNICHQVHCWLFESGFRGSFGSKKEELVDQKGNLDSIFEKMRMLLRNLPKWMLPQGFDWSKHDNFKRLVNPSNGSSITGESGDDCGRGGRTSFYDWDEVAFTDRPMIVEAALSNNTNCIFYTSSANGHNFFYGKVMTAPPGCRFRFHWKNDPRKNEAWYAAQKLKFDPVVVASEIDIDYGASVEGIYIPAEWVQAAVNLMLPRLGDRVAALDVAVRGKNLNVLGIRQGPVVEILDAWNGLDTTQSAYKAIERLQDTQVDIFHFDADGVGEGIGSTFNAYGKVPFPYTPLHGAGTPSEAKWEGENKTSKEKFANLRAECWGNLHARFKRTFDHVTGAKVYSLDELISIPDHPILISQISQPKRKWNSRGKILVESKDEMRDRGLESPDHADMLAYLFAPITKPDGYTDLFTTEAQPRVDIGMF